MEEIFFKKYGKGKPVIFIHGFCETHEIWNGFAEAFSEHNEIFVIDLPGFGASPLPPTPFSVADIAGRVLKWMDEENILRPIVIGHSLGGYVALAMAGIDPTRISGLVLFHSTIFEDSDERKANRMKVIDFVNKHGVNPFIDTFVPGLFYNKQHTAISLADKIARKTPLATLVAYTLAMRNRPSYVDVFKQLKIPTLVLGGERDSIIPAEVTEKHRLHNPYAHVQVLPSIGHMAMFESPVPAQKVIAGFIKA
jgi:pimeloyl-ACP methyl ester carboxylesterase